MSKKKYTVVCNGTKVKVTRAIYDAYRAEIFYDEHIRKRNQLSKANLLTRDLYRQIKSMNRDAMEKTINNIYDMGAKDALENAVIDLDIDKLRAELGTVSGIGEKRFEQIMEIIQRNIAETDNKEPGSEQ